MVFNKVIKSNVPMILFKNANDSNLFPPGFRFRIEGVIYTVKADCTQEVNSPMREVSLSDGRTEIIPVEVLIKDMKEISKNSKMGEIMAPDDRLTPKKADVMSKKKTVSKKKDKKPKKDKKK